LIKNENCGILKRLNKPNNATVYFLFRELVYLF